ncbi:hypothetical protein [Streptacidiphilus sp. MAP5-52]|uniref:hypothetical protein n=1 Tax=Streptacidiphilus sp. MAP5-52 TaxID=3156267 RepID=UPI003513F11E
MQSEMLHQAAHECAAASERLFQLGITRSPKTAAICAVLEDLSIVQHNLLINAGDELPPLEADPTPETVAYRRATIAYASASLLVSKAMLRAHPALDAAIAISLRPDGEFTSAERLTSYRSLNAAREVLDEAAWKLTQIAGALTGPEPAALAEITSKAAGAHAYAAVRSSATPRPPALAQTAAQAAPGATVAASPTALAASTATAAAAVSARRR